MVGYVGKPADTFQVNGLIVLKRTPHFARGVGIKEWEGMSPK